MAQEPTEKDYKYYYYNEEAAARWREAKEWFASYGLESEPEWLDQEQAITLTTETIVAMSHRAFALEHFLQWLTTKVSPETFVEASRLPLAIEASPIKLVDSFVLPHAIRALRMALVKTQSSFYESVLTIAQRLCASQKSADFDLMVHFAFILADDRPHGGPLQPLAVIEAFEAQGESKLEDMYRLIPLVLEAPPLRVKSLRAKLRYDYCPHFYGTKNKMEAAATALAAARNFGQSPVPTIKWIMQSDASGFVPLLLALDSEEAFSLLLPYMHDKKVLAELDKAAAVHPARVFRRMLQPVVAGNQDVRLLVRVKEVIKSRPAQELLQWVEGDAKAQRFIERERSAADQPLAALEDTPAPLNDPPWLRGGKRSSIPALNLEPIPTPFAFSPVQQGEESHMNQKKYCPPLDEAIACVLHIATTNTYYRPTRIEAGIEPKEVESFIRDVKWSIEYINRENKHVFETLFGNANPQEGALIFLLWRDCPSYWYLESVRLALFPRIMESLGEGAMPAIMKIFALSSLKAFDLTEGIDSSLVAPQAARALYKLKKARPSAAAWLTRYRRTAILRLIPDALGAAGPVREAAINALRWMASHTEGGREEIGKLAELYAKDEPRVRQAIGEALDADPLDFYPSKIAKLPSWFDASALSRPVLSSGGALSDPAITALAQMLAFSSPDAPYAGVEVIRNAATSASLAAFSWDLFSAWLAHEAPGKDMWAMRALGWLGDDGCAHKLTRLIRKWPGQSASARAIAGLDVLADMGTDAALVLLNSIAEKVKFKGLQEKAREKIAAIAQARDLTAEELGDRLAPDLDLDERGGLDLDFGARRFRVGFDEFLKPWIKQAKDASGEPLKDLPKPNKSDDAQLAVEAQARWKALKLDVKAIASLQITRLENMLVAQRRVGAEVFWLFFASHPLMRNLARRLLWGVYPDDNPRSPPASAFRVTEELSVTDQNDDPIEIDFGASAQHRIGLVHPMNPPPGALEGWGSLFADYEIAQPFLQLARERFELASAEKASKAIQRFVGINVESARMRSITGYGWRLGQPQDGGAVTWVEKRIQVGGKPKIVMLHFTEGCLSPGAEYDDPPTIGELTMENSVWGDRSSSTTFGDLDPVTVSEILRAPTLLFSRIGK